MLTQLPVLPLLTDYSVTALAAALAHKPVEVRRRPGTERTAGRRQGVARISKMAFTSAVDIYALDVPELGFNGLPATNRVPNVGGATSGGSWAADATHWENNTQLAAAAATFQTDIPYAAFDKYNWLVVLDRDNLVSKTCATSIANSDGSVLVRGTGTVFRKELEVGAKIVIGAYTRTVTAVFSDTRLLIDAPTGSVSESAYTATDTRVLTYNGSASAVGTRDDFKVSDVGGFALITFGCLNQSGNKLPAGTRIRIIRTTPRAVVMTSVATNPPPGINISVGDFMFAVTEGSPTTGATTDVVGITIEPTPS